MKQRRLGKDGPLVSEMGLGCWSFAGAYGPTDETESHKTLDTALDLGINFLDTANVYGNGVSEQVIGSYIKGDASKFVIATKAGIYRDPGTNVRSFNNSPEHLREELEKSLRRLGVEHVALYYIHRREAERPIEEVMETLVRFKDEGKIGGIGFSEIAPTSLRRAHAVHPVTAVQNEYSLWTRYPELGLIQTCRELGVAFVPFSPLARGMLGQKSPDPATFAKTDFRFGTPRFEEPNFSSNVNLVDEFRKYAADRGTTTIALAVAWTLARGDHLIPIPGTRTSSHLKDCVDGADLNLTSDDLNEIEQILPAGFAHGDRYSVAQWVGAERYC